MQRLRHLMLNGALGNAQLFGNLAVAHAVALGHEEHLAAAVGQGVDGSPKAGGGVVEIGVVGSEMWFFLGQRLGCCDGEGGVGFLLSENVDSAVANGAEEEWRSAVGMVFE